MNEENEGMSVTELYMVINELLEYIQWLRCNLASVLSDVCTYLPQEDVDEILDSFTEDTAYKLERKDGYMDYVYQEEDGYSLLRDELYVGEVEGYLNGDAGDDDHPYWYTRKRLLSVRRDS